jgi:hypothetical protein
VNGEIMTAKLYGSIPFQIQPPKRQVAANSSFQGGVGWTENKFRSTNTPSADRIIEKKRCPDIT